MKPVKPKKLSKARQEWLEQCAERGEVRGSRVVSVDDARAILAALEYERQRADEALDFIAGHAKDFGGTPRGQSFDIFLTKYGRPRAALTWEERNPRGKAK